MARQRLNTKIFIERARAVHGDKYDYSEVDFKTSHAKVTVRCRECNHKWDILPTNHLCGRGCKPCQYKSLPQNQRISHHEFLRQAREVQGDKFEYLSEYQGHKKKIKLKCKTCNYTFDRRAGSHLEGYGCKNCQYKNLPQNLPMPVEEFEEACRKLHQNKYEYYGDYENAKGKIRIYCKYHKEDFYQTASSHLGKEYGCPKCSMSKGEKEVESCLKNLGIEFECQKKFPKCKSKSHLAFDFYLPKQNLCIEYDGEQHYFPVSYFGGKRHFVVTKKHDAIKEKFCEENDIDLLRIPFFEFHQIKDILRDRLKC